MSYIGNSPTNIAFQTDTFSGTGSATAFTMSVAPANTTSVFVAVTGVLQDPSTYSVSGTTLTFSAAPPSGTSNISVRYLGIPASGVTTTAYRTVTNTTAIAGQTSFSIPSYTVGYINVFRNGVYLPTTDYTATTGTTVVLTNAATVGDTITTESFYVSSVLNALPTTGGTLSGNLVVSGTETVSTITSPAATALTLQSNNGTTAVTVDASQNVGIGTVSPAGKLDVSQSAAGVARHYLRNTNSGVGAYTILDLVNDTGNNISEFFCTSSTNTSSFGTNATVLQAATSNPLILGTNGTERMRIDSSGNLLVGGTGTTPVQSNAAGAFAYRPTAQLEVNGNAGQAAFFGRTNDGMVVGFYSGGTRRGSVDIAGATTSYVTSSDYRLKENIAPMTGALTTVSQLKPVTYKWKEDGKSGQGFIAHELQAIVPECVTGIKDAVETYTDKDGNESTRPVYQGIDTSFLVATLTAAIQEQQALITQLQADVEALKGKA